MHKTVVNRVSNYRYGLQLQRVAETLAAKKEEMITRATEAFVRQYQDEELTIGVLAGEPTVTSIFIPFYLDFARELTSRATRLVGAQIQNEARVLIAKWTLRGLTERILVRIRNEVFSIQPPPRLCRQQRGRRPATCGRVATDSYCRCPSVVGRN